MEFIYLLSGESSSDKPKNTVLYSYNNFSYEPLARIDTFHYDDMETAGSHHTVDVYYYHNHLNGLPEELTNEDGEIVWRGCTSLWGETLKEENKQYTVVAQNLKLQGQYLDRETGLHYNTFRYYDPAVGRFTQPDPIGLAGGMNLYAYASNPLTWIDPLGLTPCMGLPSSRKSGGTGGKYDAVNGQGLYVLHDGKNILYVGRGDAPSRLNIHANTPGKSHLRQLTIFDNNLTKAEAKFLEQRIMDLHGGAKSTDPLTNLLNQIRSYSPNNPNAGTYDIAGHSSDWGSKVLNDALSILGGKGL